MTPTLLKALAKLHPVIITLRADSDTDTEPELLTRELRRVMTVVCEIDDTPVSYRGQVVGGRWRRRLWVRR